MKVRWSVDDGYVGKSRPQYTNISLEEIPDDIEDLESLMEYVNDYIYEDFISRISFGVEDAEELIAAWRKRLEEDSQ